MADIQLEFQDVAYFRGAKQILKDISWTVRSGEHWAVLGANGSGKTTLFRIATGYEASSRGRVFLLEGWQGDLCLQEVRKKIGFVSGAIEDYLLRWRGDTTGIEVVLSGLKAWLGPVAKRSNADRDRALSLLESFNATRLANQPLSLMSTGERQICLIARARMANSEILLFDEPCAGLDLGAREDLLAAIDQGIRDRPTVPNVLITHHPEEIGAGITHVLLLREGRIVDQGPKAETLTESALEKTYGRTFRLVREGDRYWARRRIDQASS